MVIGSERIQTLSIVERSLTQIMTQSLNKQARDNSTQEDREIAFVHRGVSSYFLFQKIRTFYLKISSKHDDTSEKQNKNEVETNTKNKVSKANPQSDELCISGGGSTLNWSMKKPNTLPASNSNDRFVNLKNLNVFLLSDPSPGRN
ncbi:hypothetical protein PHMEG_0008064 [Phytophthora megakarya]|uniref:Uncharacterized protein n=1 Tax=Phytophthora megakarya TaxID=4795 RepID=A0A225WLN9_9STRA|nr:hypothetical protein PHMEG_0008064 [Phytophthora megakarya]